MTTFAPGSRRPRRRYSTADWLTMIAAALVMMGVTVWIMWLFGEGY